MKTLFIMIKCDLGATDAVGDAIVDKSPGEVEVYSITGQYDIMVKTAFAEVDEVSGYVQKFIHTIPGVRDTYTFVSFRRYGNFSVF